MLSGLGTSHLVSFFSIQKLLQCKVLTIKWLVYFSEVNTVQTMRIVIFSMIRSMILPFRFLIVPPFSLQVKMWSVAKFYELDR